MGNLGIALYNVFQTKSRQQDSSPLRTEKGENKYSSHLQTISIKQQQQSIADKKQKTWVTVLCKQKAKKSRTTIVCMQLAENKDSSPLQMHSSRQEKHYQEQESFATETAKQGSQSFVNE